MPDGRGYHVADAATRRVLLRISEQLVFLDDADDRCGRCGHTASEDHRIPDNQSPVDGVARCIFPATRDGFAPSALCDCEAFVPSSQEASDG